MRVLRDGYDFRRVVRVGALALGKAVDHVAAGLVHLFPGAWGGPEEVVAVGHPERLEVAWLAGRFLVDEGHGRLQGGIAVVVLPQCGGIVALVARHGGGAFSGKDCTKVDRSAAYAARYVAKNIVAAGLAKKCEIQLSYAIGVAHPTSIMVDTFGTGRISDQKLVEIIRENFDLRPAGIIRMLDLRRPIYKQTAAYGHFGRTDIDLPWEKLDKVETLRKYL